MTAPDAEAVDRLMADAWRPLVTETVGPWRLRWADGVSRRANSVFAAGGDDRLLDLVEGAEAFYRRRAAPPRFQVSTASAPEALAPLLAERGYTSEARTLVVRASVDTVRSADAPTSLDLSVSDAATDAWFDAYWSVESTNRPAGTATRVHRQSLLRPTAPAAFVAARHGDTVIATGQVVVAGRWGVVQCMTTRPSHRRRGAGRAVLAALATEAAARGADHLALAVMAANDGARALYAATGFTPSHEYRYATGPNPTAPDPTARSGQPL